MPIQFARLEMVKRSAGKNACQKSAYIGGYKIHCQRDGKTYNYINKKDCAFSKILLPKNVNKQFSDPEKLWNEAENKETRINSQVAKEVLLALPDQHEISLEHKIQMACDFANKYFVEEGLAAQVSLHSPGEKKDNNWHAHILLTTRRFNEEGLKLDKKARDTDARVCKGRVVDGRSWGELWRNFQNEYFEELGLEVRVDPTGIVAQKHLGPVRFRAQAFDLLTDNEQRIERNFIEASNPKAILEKITETKSVFSKQDVESFLLKHVASDKIKEVRQNFWNQEKILQLADPKTQNFLNKYTSKDVQREEHRILRYSDRMHAKRAFSIKDGQ